MPVGEGAGCTAVGRLVLAAVVAARSRALERRRQLWWWLRVVSLHSPLLCTLRHSQENMCGPQVHRLENAFASDSFWV